VITNVAAHSLQEEDREEGEASIPCRPQLWQYNAIEARMGDLGEVLLRVRSACLDLDDNRFARPGGQDIEGTIGSIAFTVHGNGEIARVARSRGMTMFATGLIQLGAHAMMGTPDGVLCHTQSSRTENRYWYNGVESGELAQCAAIAGHYGVPTIMVTGDEATCREAGRFFGSNCVTVAVKRGITREAAELYPFDETRQALYEGARRAVAAIPRCQPYKLPLPVQAKKECLVFDSPSGPGRRVSKEGAIEDVLKLLDF